MPSITEAEAELIAIRAADIAIEKGIKNHIESCPHGKKLYRASAWISGAMTVVGFVVGKILK